SRRATSDPHFANALLCGSRGLFGRGTQRSRPRAPEFSLTRTSADSRSLLHAAGSAPSLQRRKKSVDILLVIRCKAASDRHQTNDSSAAARWVTPFTDDRTDMTKEYVCTRRPTADTPL